MVIAPTARSPPYLSSEELKHMFSRLSVDCIMNGASPSARQGPIILMSRRRHSRLMRSVVRLPVRKRSIHIVDTHCEMTVASAAPRTPMFSPNMNTGSSIMFMTAPITTVSMLSREKPCAVMKAFSPRVNCTNSVPRLYMRM